MDIDLALMSVQEKRDLADRLALELASETTIYSDAEYNLWAALGDALKAAKIRSLLGRGEAALNTFAAKFGKAKYRACATMLDELVTTACPNGARKVVQIEIRRLMLKCLVDYMVERGIPVTAQTMLHQFEFLGHAIDLQFPDYLRYGLLCHVIRIAA